MAIGSSFQSKIWLLAVLLCLPMSLVAQENRLALVIGNSEYKDSPLLNPGNDAKDMAQVLETLGFEVMLHTDVNRRDMARAIRAFGRELKAKRGVGLFYYAGHGMQLDNRNFLIPVDTPMEEEDEVPYESIDVGSVLTKMESAGNALNLLILDACRNNPFPRRFRSSSRGLARVEAPVGSLVVYATAPGKVAADGEGRNGVFTGALLEQLKTPGLSLTQTIRRTRAAVVESTGGQQVPWESSSLMQDYYFAAQPTPEPEPETLFWNSAQAGNTALEYQAYLDRYPNGLFATLANARLAVMKTEAANAQQVASSDQLTALANITADAEPPAYESQNSDATLSTKNIASEQLLALASTDQAATTQRDTYNDSETTTLTPSESLSDTASSLASLTISALPSDARIRIMNIVEKYAPGMLLDKARSYDVYVTKPGYESFRETITLDQDELDVAVQLRERQVLLPATVAVPGGTFSMGCSAGDSLCESYEKPSHTVTVSAFSITTTEITVEQFGAFVDATRYITDADKNAGGNTGCYIWQDKGGISRSAAQWVWSAGKNWRDPGYEQRADFPVSCVSWNDANAYARWLGQRTGRTVRLPTEAEWEYAARAGTLAAYGASENARTVCDFANVADTSQSPTGSKWSERIACNDGHWFSAPVSTFKANPMGLYDMQGNVWEWVADNWTANYQQTPTDGEAYRKDNEDARVLRGGAWDGDERRARLSSRSKGNAHSRTAMSGFRLVIE